MKTEQDLAAQIEDLVQAHIDKLWRGAADAVERGFGRATIPTRTRTRPSTNTAKPKTRRAPSQRREPEEVQALAERLHAAVTETPGETMAVLAKRVGASVRDLNRPMTNLKRAGRLRSVGTRNRTRYFPLVGERADAA
jgi:hypothetical protein